MIKETLDRWIRLGLVGKADSMFNTPLFCLKQANGYPMVQDFRALNKTLTHKPIKFKEIYKTLAEIEKEQLQFFLNPGSLGTGLANDPQPGASHLGSLHLVGPRSIPKDPVTTGHPGKRGLVPLTTKLGVQRPAGAPWSTLTVSS